MIRHLLSNNPIPELPELHILKVYGVGWCSEDGVDHLSYVGEIPLTVLVKRPCPFLHFFTHNPKGIEDVAFSS